MGSDQSDASSEIKPTPAWSDDRNSWFDPEQKRWRPASEWEGAPPPPRPPKGRYWSSGRIALAVVIVIAAWGSGLCTGALGASSASQPKASPQAAAAITTAPTTPTPTIARTPAPTPTPTPAPQLLNFEGTGAKVQEVNLLRGLYKFSWRVEASQSDNFIVHLEGAETSYLVNELVGPTSFRTNPSSGETTVRLGGGRYALQVQTSTTKWWVTFTPL